MNRTFLRLVSGLALGATVATGCTANLHDLNPCHLVAENYCHHIQDCAPSTFSRTFSDIEDCSHTVLDKLSGGLNCPSDPSKCIDDVNAISCGSSQNVSSCGLLFGNENVVNIPNDSPSGTFDGGSPSSGKDSGGTTVPSGVTPIKLLTIQEPVLLEARSGNLIACDSSQCQDALGITSYGPFSASGHIAVDNAQNLYMVDSNALVQLSANGKRTILSSTNGAYGAWAVRGPLSSSVVAGQIDVVFAASLPQTTVLYGVQNATGTPTVSPWSPGGNINGTSFSYVGDVLAIVSSQGSLYSCQFGASCFMTASKASSIRPDEADITQAVGLTSSSAFRVGSSALNPTPTGDACTSVAMYQGTLLCVAPSGDLRVGGSTVSGASNVFMATLDATYVYWVDSSGAYYRATR